MLISRHTVVLKNAEVKCALPLSMPSEDLFKSFPHSSSYEALCKHVFGRLIVLIRLHQFFTKSSTRDILNPAQIISSNFLEKPPELPVIILNILGAATIDYPEPSCCPILYHDIKGDLSDSKEPMKGNPQQYEAVKVEGVDVECSKNPEVKQEQVKAEHEDDGLLVMNVNKRRKSMAGKSIVASSNVGFSAKKQIGVGSSAVEDREILALEALSSGLLKAGFSNRESKLKWLNTQETRLFALKLGLWWIQTGATVQACQELIAYLKVPYRIIASADSTPCLEVGLHREVADFIRSRHWPLKDGLLRLPLWTLYHLLIIRFHSHELSITDAVVEIIKPLRVAQLDDYLAKTFRNLESFNPEMATYLTKENENFAKLSLTTLGDSYKRFPPCMNLAIVTEKTRKHLKYGARMQLWPFLKDCGLPIDQQIALHKQLWDDPKQIDQELGYTLRHVYGLEGKKASKSCYSCGYIMEHRPPALSEGFGCPFYETGRKPGPNAQGLRQLLSGYGIADVEGVMKTNELEGPPVACRSLFVKVHGEEKDCANIGINPASFYKDSF